MSGRLGRVGGAARIGGRLGVEVGRLGYDRVTRRSAIPPDVAGLDAVTLGRVIGRPVERVDVVDGTEGTTDRVRLALTGEGVPPTAFVKMAASGAAIRLFGNLADLGADEVRFYRDIRPTLEIETPAVLGLDHDPRTKRFVLVLEDLQARGCTFTELVDALTVPQAAAGLDTLARLHGSQWRNPRLGRAASGAGGPQSGLGWVRANGADPLLPLFALMAERLSARIAKTNPELVTDHGRAIVAHYPAVAVTLDAGPHTVLHGDPHPGNWYVDGDRAGLLDWQAIRRGNPLRDVAYFLVLALDPPVRRAHERALLEGYRHALAGAGGPELDADGAWTTYRAMAAYPFVAATITAGFGGLQDDRTALEGLRRAAAAIEDLDAADALGLPVGGRTRRRGS